MGPMGRVFVAAVVLLLTARAGAAGFEFPDNGTEPLGRGGAFTAKADNLAALQYNVAGLAKLRGWHLQVDMNLAELTASFQRRGVYPDDTYLDANRQAVTQPWSGQPYPKVRERATVNPFPVVGVATDFGLKRFTFAFGLNGPSSVGRRAYPDEVTLPGGVKAPGPQRFDLVDENILIGIFSFAAAWRPLDWLYVGGSFQYAASNAKQHLYAMAYTNANECRNGEAWACASKAGLNVWDWFVPTGIVSTLVRPPRVDHLELGLSFRFPFESNATGAGNMTLPPALSAFPIEATSGRLKTKMPWVLRGGVRWFFGPREDELGDVEVDVVAEGWSRVKAFETVFGTTIGDIAFTVPHNYRDTVSVRAGGSYNLKLGRHKTERLGLRAGFAFDPAAAPMEWSRLDFDAFDRLSFSVGAGYKWRGFTFGAAFSFQQTLTRTVTNSQVIPIYAIGEPPAGLEGMNGTFESRTWVVSLGATLSFDELLKHRSGLR